MIRGQPPLQIHPEARPITVSLGGRRTFAILKKKAYGRARIGPDNSLIVRVIVAPKRDADGNMVPSL
jgi:hypothetical protein